MIGIYKITSPSNKIYIGQTRDYEKRLKAYKRKLGKNQTRLYRSFKKYNIKNHIFEFVEECLFEDLNIRERYWQDFYDVTGENGLNCVLTETIELPKIISEETRKKLSENNPKYWLGKKRTEEARKNMSIARKGKSISPRTIEHCKNISKSKLGNKNGMYGKCGSLNSKSKKVFCETNNKIYDSLRLCAKDLNKHENTIFKYLNGITTNKYKLKYI